MKLLFKFFVFMFTLQGLSGQSLNVFDLDISKVNTSSIKVEIRDSSGKEITNINISDLEVFENERKKKIINAICPENSNLNALSTILVIDISGSMGHGTYSGITTNMTMAKKAAIAYINDLPDDNNECAIVTFDSINYLLQDFTSDKKVLIDAINSIKATPAGGTNYNAAFVEDDSGALIISKSAKYKPVILFLSDGQPEDEPVVKRIIDEAQEQFITIFTVILKIECPESLIQITENTGGKWFDSVSTVEQAQKIYSWILKKAQGFQYCYIEWESELICSEGLMNVEITMPIMGLRADTSFQTSFNFVPKLKFEPLAITFINPEIGVKVEKAITVKALNMDFNTKNIYCSNPDYVVHPNSFDLSTGDSIIIILSYTARDSTNNFCEIIFDNSICPQKFYANCSRPGVRNVLKTIKIIEPNGDEEFVVGMDTLITWEGVSPDEAVRLDYSTDNGQSWQIIEEFARGLSYNWRVPKTPSEQCIARVSAFSQFQDQFEMVIIPPGKFKMGKTGPWSGNREESPVHDVIISRPFLFGRHEITQIQYEAVMGENPSNFKGDYLPVEKVTWQEVVMFCNKLSDLKGLDRCYEIGLDSNSNIISVNCNWSANGYRLPTEAEWEYACKAGTTTDLYSGNVTYNKCEPLDSNLNMIAFYCGNSEKKTNEVGQKEPNVFGLYDMIGNVFEYCWNSYQRYENATLTNPKGQPEGTYRIFRGGAWDSTPFQCRSSFRANISQLYRTSTLGFRIVRNY